MVVVRRHVQPDAAKHKLWNYCEIWASSSIENVGSADGETCIAKGKNRRNLRFEWRTNRSAINAVSANNVNTTEVRRLVGDGSAPSSPCSKGHLDNSHKIVEATYHSSK